MNLRKPILLSAACALLSQAATASPQAVLTLSASEEANAAQVGLQFPFAPFAFLRSERISSSVELSLGYWRGDRSGRDNRSLVDLALLPSVRFHPGGAQQNGFFVEGGIGAHLLSHTSIHDDKHFGSAFQFGDMVGVGWQFGGPRRYEAGLRIQHISNGSIKQPNQGINFLQLRFVVPL